MWHSVLCSLDKDGESLHLVSESEGSTPLVEIFSFCRRGKGDYYRLGTDSNNQVVEPQLVEAMSKKVTQIAVGSLHCLALTENGEVWIGMDRITTQ